MRLQLESNGFRDWSILIHAPVRDATRIWNCYPLFCANFNPRTHKRVRPKEEIIFSEKSSTIIIHAPVRGATAKSYKIGSDFSALFRKFIQKLGIVTFRISIF